jgi:hypothetical protein
MYYILCVLLILHNFRNVVRFIALCAALFELAASVEGRGNWSLRGGYSTTANTTASSSSTGYYTMHNNHSNTSSSGASNGSLPTAPLVPSLRAVVIAVVAANRLQRIATTTANSTNVSKQCANVATDVATGVSLPSAAVLHSMPPDRALPLLLQRLLPSTTAAAAAAAGIAKQNTVISAEQGDLIAALYRGRREHALRIREGGFADSTSCSCCTTAATANSSTTTAGASTVGQPHCCPCRVKLSRAVRLEYERVLWAGDLCTMLQAPPLHHLAAVRRALAALARELNASEARALQLACVKLPAVEEQKEAADECAALRRRVTVLETALKSTVSAGELS